MKKLSLVIPLFNEAGLVDSLFQALDNSCQQLKKKHGWKDQDLEIIIVDDGSTDETWKLLTKWQSQFPAHLLRFSRNFGHQSALLAGLAHAQGELVVTLDGDLQHPLALISDMVSQAQAGAEIVLTQRITQNYSVKNITAQLFYRVYSLISRQPFQPGVADFRLLNRKAVDTLLSLPEKRIFLRGMVQWLGFRTVILPYVQADRVQGTTKYSLSKMPRLALTGITSFSTEPLYWSFFFSLILFFLAMIYALYVIAIKLIDQSAVSGWASELFVQLILGGTTSLFLGVLGAYVAAIYDEVKQRPPYIISEEKK